MSGHLFDRRIPLVKFTGALECAEGVGHPRTNTCPLCGKHARNMMRKSEVGNQNSKFGNIARRLGYDFYLYCSIGSRCFPLVFSFVFDL